MGKRPSCSTGVPKEPKRSDRGAAQRRERGEAAAKLTGVFERYQQAAPEQRVRELLPAGAAFSREGPLSAWVVIWLMIFQRLQAKGTLSVAVRELLREPVQAYVRWPDSRPAKPLSANTSGYSQARSRLPLEVAEKVSDLIFESLQEKPEILPGLDRPLFLLDGSSILLEHTKELVAAYPPPSNQHGASHWPALRVLVAHEVVSGLAVRPCWGPVNGAAAVSEQGLAKEMMARLPVGCGVLGDRNFGVLSMAYHARQQNHPCLFRLTEARARKLNGGMTPAAKTDKAVCWRPSREDRRNNPELAEGGGVEGRLVVGKVRGVGGQPQKLYFFTTLDQTADQILEFYGYRWNIETDLRSLKREVRLHMLHAKSQAMVGKELVLAVAAYNLTRATMNQAAAALQLHPRRLSFSLAQDTINAFLPAFAQATSDPQRQDLMQEMLRVFTYSKLPDRSKRASAPRTIWPRPCSFPKRKVANKSTPATKCTVNEKGVA